MEIQYFNIIAGLELVSKIDIYDNECFFRENKIFYLKNYFSKKFICQWRLPEDDLVKSNHNELYFSVKKYSNLEIQEFLKYQLLFKISWEPTEFTEKIYLTVKTASFQNLIWCNYTLKINTLYYRMENHGYITGPYQVNNFTDLSELKQNIELGQIYIPTSKQNFEPYLKPQKKELINI